MMSREKQIEGMVEIIKPFVSGLACEEESGTCEFVNCQYCRAREIARKIYNAGYRKASEVALEVADDFQRRLRHIFLNMCNGNDYDTLNLLQIDSAIEALFDNFIAELKKKYTESEKDNG